MIKDLLWDQISGYQKGYRLGQSSLKTTVDVMKQIIVDTSFILNSKEDNDERFLLKVKFEKAFQSVDRQLLMTEILKTRIVNPSVLAML